MRRILILPLLLAAALAGCQTGTSAQGWGQIATGVGQVIGTTPADQKVAQASAQLSRYCTELQTLAAIGTFLASARHQVAAQQAQVVVNTVCLSPPQDVAQALRVAADGYAAAVAVKNGTTAQQIPTRS